MNWKKFLKPNKQVFISFILLLVIDFFVVAHLFPTVSHAYMDFESCSGGAGGLINVFFILLFVILNFPGWLLFLLLQDPYLSINLISLLVLILVNLLYLYVLSAFFCTLFDRFFPKSTLNFHHVLILFLPVVVVGGLLLAEDTCYNPLNKPVEGAAEALKEAYQTPSQLAHSPPMTFTRNYVLPARTIIESADIGISEEQVCLSVGDYTDMNQFKVGDMHKKIEYIGRNPKTVKTSALCYYGNELTDLVDSTYESLDSGWLSNCDCINSDQICCLIALRIAR